jgi:pimeloyl-ACP methyl ester carboxylesterase
VSSPTIDRILARDGARLAVRRFDGDHTPGFVLVHGLASNARTWDAVAGILSDAGHPVVAYDQRGHGVSDRPDHGYDLATALDDLDTVIAAAGFGSFVVAGQSWGANLAIAHGARSTLTPRAVVCVDGGTIDLPAMFDTWEQCAERLTPPDLRADLATAEAGIRAMHPDWSDEAIVATLANLEQRPDGTVANRLPRAAHMAILRSMWDHPPSGDHRRLTAPTTFLMATRAVDPAFGEEKRRTVETAVSVIVGATLEWIDGVHDLHLQHPDLVAARLLGAI